MARPHSDHGQPPEGQRVNVQAEYALQTLGSRVPMQQIPAVKRRVLTHEHPSSRQVESRSGVECGLHLCVKCGCISLGILPVALAEVPLPLPPALITPPHL